LLNKLAESATLPINIVLMQQKTHQLNTHNVVISLPSEADKDGRNSENFFK